MNLQDLVASLITEDPDIILLESKKLYKYIKKTLTRNYGKQFDKELLDSIYNITNDEAINEVIDQKWLAARLVENPELIDTDWQSIIDYLRNTPEAQYDSVEDLIKQSEQWHRQPTPVRPQKTETEFSEHEASGGEIIHRFPNGYYLVKLLTKEQFEYEGELMVHCAGQYDPQKIDIISLRDPDNKPHVTIGIKRDKVEQIKGKNNKPPVKKYARMVLPWLDSQFKFPENYTVGGRNDYVGSIYDKNRLWELYRQGELASELAQNENTPIEILMELGRNPKNHRLLAGNSSFPDNIIKKWVGNIDEISYRKAQILENFLRHTGDINYVTKILSNLDKIINKVYHDVRDEHGDDDRANHQANWIEAGILVELSENQKLSDDIYNDIYRRSEKLMVLEDHIHIAYQLAHNKSTPTETLLQIFEDYIGTMFRPGAEGITNMHIIKELVNRFIKIENLSHYLISMIYSNLKKHNYDDLVLKLITHKNTDIKILYKELDEAIKQNNKKNYLFIVKLLKRKGVKI